MATFRIGTGGEFVGYFFSTPNQASSFTTYTLSLIIYFLHTFYTLTNSLVQVKSPTQHSRLGRHMHPCSTVLRQTQTQLLFSQGHKNLTTNSARKFSQQCMPNSQRKNIGQKTSSSLDFRSASLVLMLISSWNYAALSWISTLQWRQHSDWRKKTSILLLPTPQTRFRHFWWLWNQQMKWISSWNGPESFEIQLVEW